MGSYADLYNNVNEYYSGIDRWETLNQLDLTTNNYYSQVTASNMYEAKMSNSGDVLAYVYYNTSSTDPGPIQEVDSNVVGGNITTQIGVQNSVDDVTGKVSSTSVLNQGANFYFGTIKPAIMAAATGISLGKTIDSVLYNLNPDFWDTHGMAGLNPETWNNITGGDNTGLNYVFNAIFGLDPNNRSQMYIDERAYAYMALWLAQSGALDRGPTAINEHYGQPDASDYFWSSEWVTPIVFHTGSISMITEDRYGVKTIWNISGNYDYIVIMHIPNNYAIEKYYTFAFGHQAFSGTIINSNGYTHTFQSFYYTADEEYNKSHTNFHVAMLITATEDAFHGDKYVSSSSYTEFSGSIAYQNAIYTFSDLVQFLFNGTISGGDPPEGITGQPDAVQPQIDPTWTLNQTDIYLRNRYPTIYNNTVINRVVQPDGSTKEYRYIPVPYPTGGTDEQPSGGHENEPTQQNPTTGPDTPGADNQADETIDKNRDRDKDDTGDGETPENEDSPTAIANALFTLYQIDSSQLVALGGVLWNSSIIEQIKQMFTSPMDAFIFLKQSFLDPGTTIPGTIKLGYYNTGVSAGIVTGNIAYCPCGSVNLNEYFHNAFDYNNVKIRLYLPFYGFATLDVDDVMRGTIGVNYKGDLYSGQTLIEVYVLRDGNNNLLYTFECNTSLDIPLTNGNYASMLAGFMAIGGAAIGTAASFASGNMGGVALGVSAMQLPSAVSRLHPDVFRGGKISGNTGATCVKTPFIVIERPQVALPDNYPTMIGNPSCYIGKLARQEGFVRIKDIDLKCNATDEEQKEIEEILKEGVFIK